MKTIECTDCNRTGLSNPSYQGNRGMVPACETCNGWGELDEIELADDDG